MIPLPNRRQWLQLGASGLLARSASAWAQEGPLQIGLVPFLTPGAMLLAFRPLREHLQQRLRRPVEFYTARDIVELVEQSRRGAYEISMMPAHLAGLALSDWQFQPLAASVSATKVLVLVRNDQSIASASALRGRRIGSLGQLSLSAAVGLLWLRQQRIEAQSMVAQSSINSALLNLERGDIDALIATRSQLDSLPPGQFTRHAVLTELSDIPAPIYLARPGTPPASLQRWREALHSFTPDPGMAATAANSRLHGLDAGELQRLAALRDLAREQWAAASASR